MKQIMETVFSSTIKVLKEIEFFTHKKYYEIKKLDMLEMKCMTVKIKRLDRWAENTEQTKLRNELMSWKSEP